MSDPEFDKLMQCLPKELFDADFTEKALRHFRELHTKLKEGTPEEQEEAKATLDGYERERQKMRTGFAKMMGKTEEEMQKILCNEQNYSQEQWERIQEAGSEMSPVIESVTPVKKKTKKKSKKPKGWVKS